MHRVQDKVVIVTGDACDIGAATTRRFSTEGASVVLVDRQKTVEQVAAELPSERTLAFVADVSDSRLVQGVVDKTVARFGKLDVFVNNAGIAESGDPMEISDEQWLKVIGTDLNGFFFGCRAARPIWRHRRAPSSTPLQCPERAAIGA